MKYIIFKNGTVKTFPENVSHSTQTESKGDVASAGYFKKSPDDGIKAYGKSHSMNIPSKTGDSKILEKHLSTKTYYPRGGKNIK